MIHVTPEAQALADRGYLSVAFRALLDDNEFCYMAYDPDLRGLMVQCATMQEAVDDLRVLRAEFIQLLLDTGQPIAEPGGCLTVERGNGWQAVFLAPDLENFWGEW